MGEWKGIVGQFYTPEEFDAYVRGLKNSGKLFADWRPQFVVLHNTSNPTLAMRPNGFTHAQIQNLADYYRGMGWSAGPHCFVDQHGIWAFTPLWTPGVHSPSWNEVSWGVEVLGEYQSESAAKGPGANVVHNAVCCLATLHDVAGLDSHSLRPHHADPLTTHKDCPGKNILISDIIERTHNLILKRRGF